MNYFGFMSLTATATLLIVFLNNEIICVSELHYKGCPVPAAEQIVNFKWDFTGVDPGGYYMPLGTAHSVYNELFVKDTHETRKAHLEENLDTFCLRFVWNDTEVEFRAYGIYMSQDSWFECKHVGLDHEKWVLQCISKEGYNHYVYVVKTDGKTWAIASVCFEDGRYQWFVLSKLPVLPKDVVTDILEHAKLLGSANEEHLTVVPYNKCSA